MRIPLERAAFTESWNIGCLFLAAAHVPCDPDDRREMGMQRRNAIATAGAVTATATAAVIALGANFGIFGLTDENSKVGKFPAVDARTNAPAVMSPSGGPPAQDDHHGHEPANDDHHGHDADD